VVQGMLWYPDNKKLPLEQQVREAAEYFLGKYGEQALVCNANPRTLGAGAPDHVGVVHVVANPKILPGHLWLGTSDDDGD